MSSKRPEPLDLDRDLPTTPEDVAVLRRLRWQRPLRFVEYLEFLSRQEFPDSRVRRRTHAGYEPFEL